MKYTVMKSKIHKHQNFFHNACNIATKFCTDNIQQPELPIQSI